MTLIVLGAITALLGLLAAALSARVHHLGVELCRARRRADRINSVLATYRAADDQAISDFLRINGGQP